MSPFRTPDQRDQYRVEDPSFHNLMEKSRRLSRSATRWALCGVVFAIISLVCNVTSCYLRHR